MKLTTTDQSPQVPDGRSTRVARRSRLRLIIWLLVPTLILLLTGGGYLLLRPQVQPLALPPLPAHLNAADLGLSNWQAYQRPLPAHPLDDPRLPASPQINPTLALLEDAAGQVLISSGQIERGLAYLHAAAQSDQENLRYSNDYSLALRDHKRYADELAYFEQLAQHDRSANVLIGFALSYVDQMRACPPPPDGLVCQAQDSSRSISVLNEVLGKNPYNVFARSARGLNHLYWPSLMGHLPQAQVDLQYVVALSVPLSAISQALTPSAYVALGDVFAKDGQIEQARNVWLNGKSVVADAAQLDQRLNIAPDQLVNQENGPLRGLGVSVDTDLTLFWKTGR